MESPLKHSDVVFMYTADAETYKAYNATWVAWGGASEGAVKTAQELGIHYAASMWTLTAGAENLHKRADLRDAVSKDILLEPIIVPWQWDHTYEGTPTYFGCTNNPVFREFSRQRVISAMKTGADGLHIDDHLGSAGSFWHGGCFCDYCVAGFNGFLNGIDKPTELADVEIDTFNYRDFLRERVSTREEYKNKRTGLPLTDLYWLYQVRAAAASVVELRKLAEEVKGGPITCSANTFMPNPVHLVVTPNLTHCVGEAEFRQDEKNPPDASSVTVFKFMDAIGKSMAATGSGWNWAYAHAHDNAVGLVRLWIAESYALGHRLMAPHRKWAFTQEKGTHWYQSKPEDFSYLYQFVRKNADLLDGYEPYSQIAVVFSSKSARLRGIGVIREACKRLADSNLQFSIVVAGDEWLEDRLSIDTLKKFDTAIVPEPADLSEIQKAALQKWESVKSKKANHITSADDIENIDFDKPAARVTGPPNIWVLPRLNPNGPVVCHILNRNYDEDKGSVIPAQDIEVVLAAPLIGDTSVRSCKLLSPDGEAIELDMELRDDGLSVSIPVVKLWSLLVIERD
ncbi:hypothetical protein ACFL6S_04860 [Candidatus Poribacteria bacterium]